MEAERDRLRREHQVEVERAQKKEVRVQKPYLVVF